MRRLLLASALTLVAPLAAAQEQECANDVRTHCKDASGKDVLTCLETQKAHFSDGCRKKLDAVKSSWAGFVTACKPDLTALCGDKKVADGTLATCIKGSEAKLGNACKTSFAQMKMGVVALPAGIPGLSPKKKK